MESGGRDRKALQLGADRDWLTMTVAVVVTLRVRAAVAAGFRARPKRFRHDLADGPGAAAALGTAAEAAIDLPCRSRQITGLSHGIAHVVVGNDVAGTNDHWVVFGGPVKTFTID